VCVYACITIRTGGKNTVKKKYIYIGNKTQWNVK